MDDESIEFDFEENLDQFYPGLRPHNENEDDLDEKGRAIRFHPRSGFQSRYGKLAHRDWRGKKCQFFKNSDARVSHSVNFSDATYRSMDTLLNDLSKKMEIPFGVRSIHTPKSGSEVTSLDELQHGRAYICRELNRPKPLNLDRTWENSKWNNRKPLTSQENFSRRLAGKYLDGWWYEQQRKSGRGSSESRQMGFKPRSPKDEEEMLERTPKKITVYRNGCWLQRHLVLLNKRLKFRPTEEFFEALLQDVGEMFHRKFTRLIAADESYREVKSVKEVLEGPDVYIALQHLEDLIQPPGLLEPIGKMAQKGAALDPLMADKSGVIRKGKSLGKWKVKIITADENESGEDAGTTSNLTLWVYGDKRDSGPIPLTRPNGEDSFGAGSVEEIDVKTGKLGSIYKIRLESDYSGDSPSWKCVELQMTDINTERSLLFPVNKWFSREHEDGSLSREVAMLKKSGDPLHPTVTYEILIATGDRWGAGTDAEPSITLYGERGDSGERQLLRDKAQLKYAFGTRAQYKPFKKHQIDAFLIDAVSLGRLKKIKIGHDKTKAGDGWFLDKITINVLDGREQQQGAGGSEGGVKTFNFPCGRWLDSGQDDGRITREIFASEHRTGIDEQKEIWDIEQWKYERGNELLFVSEASGRPVMIRGDATFNARGSTQDPFCVIVVKAKMQNGVRIFRSGLHSGYHLGIDKGKVYAEMKGGVHCEFKVLPQKDRSVCLQSVKSPTHYISFDAEGNPSHTNSNIKSELKFRVYCRGSFRNQGVIVIQTSATQTLFIDEDNQVVGYGVRDVIAYFRVHKIAGQRGVRMFQSIAKPDCFIQMKGDVVDGNGIGDEHCHFFVERNRLEGGSFRLLHVKENKYLGLTPEGEGMAASEEDVEDLVFHPEVIEYGVPKKKRPDFRSSMTTPRTLHIDTSRTGGDGGGSTRRSQIQNPKTSSRMSTLQKESSRQLSKTGTPKSQTDPRTPHLAQQREEEIEDEEDPLTPGGQQGDRSETRDQPRSPGADASQGNQNGSPAKSPKSYRGSNPKTPGVN
ncbi:uncharacterized protein LOC142339645 isoform X1 [Convolutriloba macropyga]|uniref:uncharacterized protein LOC142339645 isoform X1 n=1 Tax=Convolutriloba macropyga TaxID=536237 RepID=UPI003F51D146